eukprot:GHVQ01006727.1.p1 GENE.GHVQ01006727.1~~GHVQ01006727.1.p1  ORF type:complete len:710 (+),score=88.60 GHVQ01006727.1:2846-4975(+)
MVVAKLVRLERISKTQAQCTWSAELQTAMTELQEWISLVAYVHRLIARLTQHARDCDSANYPVRKRFVLRDERDCSWHATFHLPVDADCLKVCKVACDAAVSLHKLVKKQVKQLTGSKKGNRVEASEGTLQEYVRCGMTCAALATLSVTPLLLARPLEHSVTDEKTLAGGLRDDDNHEDSDEDEHRAAVEAQQSTRQHEIERCREVIVGALEHLSQSPPEVLNNAQGDISTAWRRRLQAMADILPELILLAGSRPAHGLIHSVSEQLWPCLCGDASDLCIRHLVDSLALSYHNSAQLATEESNEQHDSSSEDKSAESEDDAKERNSSGDEGAGHKGAGTCFQEPNIQYTGETEQHTSVDDGENSSDDDTDCITLSSAQTFAALLDHDNSVPGVLFPQIPLKSSPEKKKEQKRNQEELIQQGVRTLEIVRSFFKNQEQRSVILDVLLSLLAGYKAVLKRFSKQLEKSSSLADYSNRYGNFLQNLPFPPGVSVALGQASSRASIRQRPPIVYAGVEKPYVSGESKIVPEGKASDNDIRRMLNHVGTVAEGVLTLCCESGVSQRDAPSFLKAAASMLSYIFKFEAATYTYRFHTSNCDKDIPETESKHSFPATARSPDSACTKTLTKAFVLWTSAKNCKLSSAFFSYFADRYPSFCRFLNFTVFKEEAWKHYIGKECSRMEKRVQQHPAFKAPFLETQDTNVVLRYPGMDTL